MLSKYINSFWVFESAAGHPETSSRVVAPTGCAKIVLPYKNNLHAANERLQQKHAEGRIQFIGVADEPIVVSSPANESGTIIMELTPHGACRFTNFAMHEVTNLIFPFDELYGSEGAELQNRMGDTENVSKKVDLLQQFLVKKFCKVNEKQSIVDYAADAILRSNGRMPIKEIERKTGYSARYLGLLFHHHVGVSPKTLASIARFQHFYKMWAANPSTNFYKKDLYDFYYDQAHFIKEFKRFTGFSPNLYAETDNEFGRIFHK